MSEERDTNVPRGEGVSRRRLLKALAAAGGAAAATAVLPGSWQRPRAHLGALPAHAQVSNVPPVISGLRIAPYLNGNAVAFNGGYTHQAAFLYYDVLGGVSNASLITASVAAVTKMAGGTASCPPPVPEPGTSLTALGAARFGDAINGSIVFPFTLACSWADFSLCVTLEAQGRKSDPLCGDFIPSPSTPQ